MHTLRRLYNKDAVFIPLLMVIISLLSLAYGYNLGAFIVITMTDVEIELSIWRWMGLCLPPVLLAFAFINMLHKRDIERDKYEEPSS